MKRNKSGISLIVLVITIIVMIILAATVVIALDNSGIIGKANEAVNASNLKQVQHLASLIWAEAYLEEDINNEDITESYIRQELAKQGVDASNYSITVTDSGVAVEKTPTLGDLITSAEDYGKLVDYSANNVTDWQVLYEDEAKGYVFLISKNIVEDWPFQNRLDVSELTYAEKNLYDICRVGNWNKYELNNTYTNSKGAAYLIRHYNELYANTAVYGSNVVGAMGGPTIELLAASYNAKYGTNISVVADVNRVDGAGQSVEGTDRANGKYGYFIDNAPYSLTKDDFYCLSEDYSVGYWTTSPTAADGGYGGTGLYIISAGFMGGAYYNVYGIRPVVCLKSTTPAIATESGYSLIK